MYVKYYGRDYATLYDYINVAGIAAEDASYDAEGFLSVKEVDTRCAGQNTRQRIN